MHVERALNALRTPRPERKEQKQKRQNRFDLIQALSRNLVLRSQARHNRSRNSRKNPIRGGLFYMLLSRTTPLSTSRPFRKGS